MKLLHFCALLASSFCWDLVVCDPMNVVTLDDVKKGSGNQANKNSAAPKSPLNGKKIHSLTDVVGDDDENQDGLVIVGSKKYEEAVKQYNLMQNDKQNLFERLETARKTENGQHAIDESSLIWLLLAAYKNEAVGGFAKYGNLGTPDNDDDDQDWLMSIWESIGTGPLITAEQQAGLYAHLVAKPADPTKVIFENKRSVYLIGENHVLAEEKYGGRKETYGPIGNLKQPPPVFFEEFLELSGTFDPQSEVYPVEDQYMSGVNNLLFAMVGMLHDLLQVPVASRSAIYGRRWTNWLKIANRKLSNLPSVTYRNLAMPKNKHEFRPIIDDLGHEKVLKTFSSICRLLPSIINNLPDYRNVAGDQKLRQFYGDYLNSLKKKAEAFERIELKEEDLVHVSYKNALLYSVNGLNIPKVYNHWITIVSDTAALLHGVATLRNFAFAQKILSVHQNDPSQKRVFVFPVGAIHVAPMSAILSQHSDILPISYLDEYFDDNQRHEVIKTIRNDAERRVSGKTTGTSSASSRPLTREEMAAARLARFGVK